MSLPPSCFSVLKMYIQRLNYPFQTGSLTDLQKKSIITLIPKQNKDITSLEKWRLISLLNVDYKIATENFANRVKSVISSITLVNVYVGLLVFTRIAGTS